MTKLRCMLCCLMICTITIDARTVNDIYKRISAQVSLKVPGNQSRNYSLAFQGAVDDKGIYLLESEEKIPLIITERIERDNVKCVMVVSITALEDVYFNYQQQLKTGFRHNDCMFYLPGFWYSRNLRSPKGAPSFHISESWLVREDRLSSPLTGIFNQKDGRYMTVARKDDFQWDALATHQTGEIILSGKTSLGFTGFESHDGTSTLSFGFPYREAPKTYIRKLTLAPEVTSFQYLKKGETVLLTWEFIEGQATDYSDFICHTWEYCYDTYRPQPVKIPFSPEEIKGVLSNYFVESFVGDKALAYYSSPEMKVAACANMNVAEIGFVGRVLLNAFNAWWKIQCKLPPKTKRFCPLKTFNNAPLKSLDRWGYYYFSLFPSVCSHFTDTFSCQLNPVRRMYNTIHNGICYCRVSDCIIPIVRWQLRGDDDGLAPMSVLYYIEQDGSFLGIKVHKEEVIQYEQRAPFDSLEFRFQCAFYFCHLKRTHKFRSIRIICPYALLAGFIPHCCGKEVLPGTG